ncbi:hypothetical protein [Geodermatophilus sp. URMC 65]
MPDRGRRLDRPARRPGNPPEIRGHDHGAAWDGDLVGRGAEIGDHTTLREYATVHSGSAQVTRIGSDSLLMDKIYVGHDGDLGDGVTLAAGGHAGPALAWWRRHATAR